MSEYNLEQPHALPHVPIMPPTLATFGLTPEAIMRHVVSVLPEITTHGTARRRTWFPSVKWTPEERARRLEKRRQDQVDYQRRLRAARVANGLTTEGKVRKGTLLACNKPISRAQ